MRRAERKRGPTAGIGHGSPRSEEEWGEENSLAGQTRQGRRILASDVIAILGDQDTV
jgi:hypothetical protein